jgi:hypothetical protein
VDEMKFQTVDEGIDSTERGKLCRFLTSLTQDQNYARESRYNPQTFVAFFNELDTKKRTMLVTSVSFFNEVATEKQKLSSIGFIF